MNIKMFFINLFFLTSCGYTKINPVYLKYQDNNVSINIVLEKIQKNKSLVFGEMTIENISNDKIVNFSPYKRIYIYIDNSSSEVYIDSIASVVVNLSPQKKVTYPIYYSYRKELNSLEKSKIVIGDYTQYKALPHFKLN